MPLVTSKEMFEKAYNGGYAIGAFNVNNMEIVQGITEACQEEHAPVILQVSKGARAYANHTYLVKLVEAAVECCPDIPIVLHLDHGPDFETCKSCIDGGFTSVMIDASSKPFAENIEITKRVVEYVKMINDHGGRMPNAIGVPEEQLREAAKLSVCKINIDSDLRLAMTGTIRQFMEEHPDKFDPREYLKPARANIKELVRHKLVDVLGCAGKA